MRTILVGLLFLLIALLWGPKSALVYAWTTATIDSEYSAGRFSALAVDGNNNYLIVYMSSDISLAEPLLRFAKSTNAGANWTTSTIGNTNDPQQREVAILVDSNTYIIGYQERINSGKTTLYGPVIKTSEDRGATWSSRVAIDTTGGRGRYLSLTKDPAGNYLASYGGTGASPTGLYFAKSTNAGASWTTTTLAASGSITDTSIYADSSNYLITYQNNNGNLGVAISTNAGASWTTSTIDAGTSVGNYSLVTADSAGNYLVSYYDATNTDLKFAKSSNASTWDIAYANADSSNNVGQATTIKSSGNNYLISHVDSTNNTLLFTKSTNAGASWTTETVDSSGTVGTFDTSLALDNNGNYLISYFDTTSGDLEFAQEIVDSTSPSSFSLSSPSGYSKDGTRPTLVFHKSSDTGGISSYSVSLDEGKNRNFTTTGIPSSVGTAVAQVWKDDNLVKVEFFNENDSDSGNDQIKVYFKGLDQAELTEGKHSWKVTVYDTAGNATTKTQEFFIDRTPPLISNLTTVGSSRMPSFSGQSSDPYRGSHKTNTNLTTDTFEAVSSGLASITLGIKKLQKGDNYFDYLSREFKLSDSARFYLTTPAALPDGYYQINLSLTDQAGNTYTNPPFYLGVNYQELKPTLIQETQIPVQTTEESKTFSTEEYAPSVTKKTSSNLLILLAIAILALSFVICYHKQILKTVGILSPTEGDQWLLKRKSRPSRTSLTKFPGPKR